MGFGDGKVNVKERNIRTDLYFQVLDRAGTGLHQKRID